MLYILIYIFIFFCLLSLCCCYYAHFFLFSSTSFIYFAHILFIHIFLPTNIFIFKFLLHRYNKHNREKVKLSPNSSSNFIEVILSNSNYRLNFYHLLFTNHLLIVIVKLIFIKLLIHLIFLSYYFDIILKVNFSSSLFVKTSKKAKYNSCDDHNYGENFLIFVPK